MNIPFQETWCILNLDHKDRILNMQKIEKDYHIDNIHYLYTYRKPYYLYNMHELIPSLRTNWYDMIYKEHNKDVYKNVYDCFINHYNVIKQAYLRGVESILILEDDLHFIVKEEVIDYMLKQIPKDYDIIKFYNNMYHKGTATRDNIKFEIQREKLTCLIMYALSRNGMKKYLDYFENNPPMVADLVFDGLIKKHNCKIYSLIPQIIFTESYKGCSTIL